MTSRASFVLLAGLLLAACTSEIGDECSTSADCATNEADRLCLSDALEGFPGGYCTEFNCEPGSCPEEAVCVGYRTTLANAPECSGGRPRLQRSYCMRSCSSDSDCRGSEGYVCLDVTADEPWGAEVLETGSRVNKSKICALPYSGAAEPDRSADVCAWEPPTTDAGAKGTDPGESPAVVADSAVAADSTADAGTPLGEPDSGTAVNGGIAIDSGAAIEAGTQASAATLSDAAALGSVSADAAPAAVDASASIADATAPAQDADAPQ